MVENYPNSSSKFVTSNLQNIYRFEEEVPSVMEKGKKIDLAKLHHYEIAFLEEKVKWIKNLNENIEFREIVENLVKDLLIRQNRNFYRTENNLEKNHLLDEIVLRVNSFETLK